MTDVPIHAQPDQGAALEVGVCDTQKESEDGVIDHELDWFPPEFDRNHRTGCGLRNSQYCFPHLILDGVQGRHNVNRDWDHVYRVKEAGDSQGAPYGRQ